LIGKRNTPCQPVNEPTRERADNSELVLWNAATSVETVHAMMPMFEAHDLSIQFSPDGSTLVAYGTYAKNGQVLLLNPIDGKLRTVLPQQGGPIAFSPDGKLLATTDQHDASAVTINVWALQGDQLRQSLIDRPTEVVSWPYVINFRFMAFSADGRRLGIYANDYNTEAPGAGPTRARQWDVATGSMEKEWQSDWLPTALDGHATWDHLYRHRSGQKDNRHSLTDAKSGKEWLNYEADGLPSMGGRDCGFVPSFDVAPCPNRPYVAISELSSRRLEWLDRLLDQFGVRGNNSPQATTRLYDLNSKRLVAFWTGEQFGRFSRDGQFFSAGGRWNAPTNIYRLLPDRPWWYLVAGWLGLLSAVETCVWLAGRVGRIFFMRTP
jgi:WD40 repeat protein